MKKILVVSLLCLISFGVGWFLRFFYPYWEPPLKTKAIQRWELRKSLQIGKGELSDVVLVEEKDMKDYTRRLLRLRWGGLPLEAFLLIPHGTEDKMPAILAIPGHHTTKAEVSGERPSRFGVDYGRRLVEAGFCVLVPDIPFSEDMEREDHVALNLIMAGTHLTGVRLSYLKVLLDYLSSLPFVDPERLGCIGWSMGGALTMYLAAVDTRVKVVAISSYFGTYRNTFMRLRQSTDNYIPGILNFGEMADVACLIAPRPLFIEGGDSDPEFPLEAFKSGITDLQECYKGYPNRLKWTIFQGGHKFYGNDFIEWFKRWL